MPCGLTTVIPRHPQLRGTGFTIQIKYKFTTLMWLEIIKLALPKWNQKVYTEYDFDKFCKRESLKVKEVATGENGLYVVYRGKPFIFVDPSLRGAMRLWVCWHEAAHHLLHIPSPGLFGMDGSKGEWQANAFSACAMIPFPLLKKMSLDEIEAELNYPRALCNIRETVFERYGF